MFETIHLSARIPAAAAGRRLDQVLAELFSGYSRSRLQQWIKQGSVLLNGHPTERLPNHASFVFKGVDGNELLMVLDAEGFSCSSGSACKTGNRGKPMPTTTRCPAF